ncbi:putative periplasmic lipoprotein [Acinetobacter stercoris]|uniref:Lipoprotein n=1 Tax=Acinetobacter stercoris TaxID=2126983 RepID=A0A2U3N216_9GAMM|nr:MULTISPECIES: hypothetical protein [Acinetobacter]SPL71730.1 hypothetical protein KPC_2908 [Acinetobacter stercoris]
MKRIFILLFLTPFLVSCAASPLGDAVNAIGGQRAETMNDIVAAWVGASEQELVSKWGPPRNSYTLSNGNRVISYNYEYSVGMSDFFCERKFLVEHGTITKWGIRGKCQVNGKVVLIPKSTPIPQPTM